MQKNPVFSLCTTHGEHSGTVCPQCAVGQVLDRNDEDQMSFGFAAPPASVFDTQVGGSHYQGFAIQPTDFIHQNDLGFIAGNVIKYVCRYKLKGQAMSDLQKARHYLDMLIEFEEK